MGKYIQLFSPHGLIRYENPEIGRDKDTGGQVKYLIELLESLSKHPEVRKADLFTRRIVDKRVSSSYSEEIERVNDKARIIRVTCGGNQYRPKETLWNYLDEFVDKTIRFIEKENDIPDVAHGHYADGNYLAGEISSIFGIPFIATAHSLGLNKKNILLSEGMSEKEIERRFNMRRRIAAEEYTLNHADAIIVSTQHEIEKQYSFYQTTPAKFVVIPPGVNTDIFYPFYRLDMPSFKMSMEQEHAVYNVHSEIGRFLFNPDKPLILSIGRADRRKNFDNIIQAYGEDPELQAMANLAIFAGVRKDISQMPEDEQDILTNLLLLLDKYDLYGKMAIPKKNDPGHEVPEIYRLAARKKGVFVNATPGENFGLTILEAAACGLPVVASPTGGPKEILAHCQNGILVDVEQPDAIAKGLKKIIARSDLWETYSANGIAAVNDQYSWKAHAEKYTRTIEELMKERERLDPGRETQITAYGERLLKAEALFISDLDGTLVDEAYYDGLDELTSFIDNQRGRIVFGVATGRNKELARQAFDDYNLPDPDVLICSAGSEIYYTEKMIPDKGYESHIDYQWKRDKLQEVLKKFSGIHLQEPGAQWQFKLSYYVDHLFDDDRMADLHKLLDDHKLRAKILLTENKYLDFLPIRASKGNAVRYLAYKWKVPLEQIITAGNSGNDIDMLKGRMKGIVVANYSAEMEELKKQKLVYFAQRNLSEGVLEGLKHYLMEA